ANDLEYQQHNAAKAKPYWANTRKYSEASLDLAKKFRSSPDYGTAIFTAHMALGLEAMHDGRRNDAAKHLLAAGEAQETEELQYPQQFTRYKLPAWLLKAGVREPVVRFLERFAQTNIANRQALLDAAAEIRAGQKPLWYRY